MSKKAICVFSREFKLKSVRRMLAGENVSALAREVKSSAQRPVRVAQALRSGGPEALRGRGRPPKVAAAVATRSAPAKSAASAPDARANGSPSWSARSASSRSNSIFFGKPCGKSRERAGGAPGLARRGLRGHRSDDDLPAARRAHDRTNVRVGRRQPGRLLPRLGCVGAASRGDRTARRNPACGHCQSALRLPPDHDRDRPCRLVSQPQTRVAPDAPGQSALSAASDPSCRSTTDSNHGWRVVPNLARHMVPTGLDQLWVADITYIRLQEEFAYLAIVLDAFSRRVVGWALATHLQASLAIDALTMALVSRNPAPGSVIHHSDSYWMKASFRAA